MQNKITKTRQKHTEIVLELHPSSNIISIYFLSPVATQIESVDLYMCFLNPYQTIRFRQFCDLHSLNTLNYAHHDAFCLVSK